jgi:hypothetical protein
MPYLIISGSKTRLLKTGQITSYGSGTGVDDGALQKGIAKSYTVLTTGQYAGTTNITINSKTDVHSNACVLDNMTGLMWSRTASASVGPASDGLLPWTTTGVGATAEGIFPYVLAANVASLANYTDWRAPDANEIDSLWDWEATTCMPDSTAFPVFASNYYWSSTSVPAVTTRATKHHSSTGQRDTGSTSVKTNTALVILVRGG